RPRSAAGSTSGSPSRSSRGGLMKTNFGSISLAVVALFLGVAAAAQFRSQDVYSRSLQLETPSSLTTLIANLSDRNNELRNEIFDLRRDIESATNSVYSGQGTLSEAERPDLLPRV